VRIGGDRGGEQAARPGQLGVEQAGAGGAAFGVVAEQHQLQAEERAGAEAADVNRHPVGVVEIEARLRPVVGVVHHEGRRRRRGEREPLRLAAPAGERRAHRGERGGAREADRHRLVVAVDDRDPVAGGRDGERRRLDPFAGQPAEQLAGLLFDLLLLAADERDDVAE